MADFETIKINTLFEIPALNRDVMKDSSPFVAAPAHQEALGFPGELVDDWQAMGFDKNSVFGDPRFVDPENNNYQVQPESPALTVGFKNFEMGSWGLTSEFPPCWETV